MKACNGSNEAKPESVSYRVTASLKPIKSLEHIWMLGNGNTWPVIRYRNNGTAVAVLYDLDSYLPGRTAMFDRIVHKIGDRIENEVPIAGNTGLLIPNEAQPCAFFFSCGIV